MSAEAVCDSQQKRILLRQVAFVAGLRAPRPGLSGNLRRRKKKRKRKRMIRKIKKIIKVRVKMIKIIYII